MLLLLLLLLLQLLFIVTQGDGSCAVRGEGSWPGQRAWLEVDVDPWGIFGEAAVVEGQQM